MLRVRRRELTAKLFSLLGGLTTGLLVTMAVVIPMPSQSVQTLAERVEAIPSYKFENDKSAFESEPTQIVAAPETGATVRSEEPLPVTATPLTPLAIENPLPDQYERNLLLQQEIRSPEPSPATHQLAQAWEPTSTQFHRYLPAAQSGNIPRRTDPGQPGIAGRGSRHPGHPGLPGSPSPAGFGKDLR